MAAELICQICVHSSILIWSHLIQKDPSPSRSDIVVKSTSDGDKYIELGKKKRATIRVFKGTPLIDIREFYTDAGGVDKPGKKGLSLGLDQVYYYPLTCVSS